jgi:hypothetical protein
MPRSARSILRINKNQDSIEQHARKMKALQHHDCAPLVFPTLPTKNVSNSECKPPEKKCIALLNTNVVLCFS